MDDTKLNPKDHPVGTRAMISGKTISAIYCKVLEWSTSSRFVRLEYETMKSEKTFRRWFDMNYFSLVALEVLPKKSTPRASSGKEII